MTIELGWWLIPLIVTVISFVIAGMYKPYSGGYINIDIEGMFRCGIALIVSLIAWLSYALAT